MKRETNNQINIALQAEIKYALSFQYQKTKWDGLVRRYQKDIGRRNEEFKCERKVRERERKKKKK